MTPQQPTGKWVGDVEYTDDDYVCRPGQKKCGPHQRPFRAFCRAVYDPPAGFAAVLLDVDLDGKLFAPCPQGT